jgi:hypothetical protein
MSILKQLLFQQQNYDMCLAVLDNNEVTMNYLIYKGVFVWSLFVCNYMSWRLIVDAVSETWSIGKLSSYYILAISELCIGDTVVELSCPTQTYVPNFEGINHLQ